MAKHLARCLVDSKEVLAGEVSASNLVLGLRFSCNDLDVVGEGTINNKRFLKCVLQLSSNTLQLCRNFLAYSCQETCPQRDAEGGFGPDLGFEFKRTARTDGDPEVMV